MVYLLKIEKYLIENDLLFYKTSLRTKHKIDSRTGYQLRLVFTQKLQMRIAYFNPYFFKPN